MGKDSKKEIKKVNPWWFGIFIIIAIFWIFSLYSDLEDYESCVEDCIYDNDNCMFDCTFTIDDYYDCVSIYNSCSGSLCLTKFNRCVDFYISDLHSYCDYCFDDLESCINWCD